MSPRLFLPAAWLALTLADWFVYPGHTWLQSDTQIYVPILEHLDNPAVLAKDPVATHAHVSWTVYDELTVLARRWLGLPFRQSLQLQQFLTRAAGVAGVTFLARGLGLGWPGSLFCAALMALGAVINGPAVLLVEYEPVPRGFAVQLILLALGCATLGRWGWSGAAGALALLYHPPTAAPFWLSALIYWLAGPDRRRPLPVLYWLAAAVPFAWLLRSWQHGEREPQPFWGLIDPALEALQRYRGAYNWISLWPQDWLWQYPLLFLFTALAWRRLRPQMNPALRWFSLALPLYGLLTIPVQWLLLDQWKWILLPQFQPARAVLFITAFALLLGAAAGARAAAAGRWLEALAWFLPVYAIPVNGLVAPLFLQGLADSSTRQRLLLTLGLASLATLAFLLQRRLLWLPLAAALLPWAALAPLGKPFPNLHTPELEQLVAWAREATSSEDVFLFADAGRNLAPGIFRAEARRNLYVDWKSGGQVNLLRRFAFDWKKRWFEDTGECRAPVRDAAHYRALGVTHLILAAQTEFPGQPVYANPTWRVFRLQ